MNLGMLHSLHLVFFHGATLPLVRGRLEDSSCGKGAVKEVVSPYARKEDGNGAGERSTKTHVYKEFVFLFYFAGTDRFQSLLESTSLDRLRSYS